MKAAEHSASLLGGDKIDPGNFPGDHPNALTKAEQAMAGPAVSAARVPKRSSTTPLTGIPANRPTAKAVIVCAAVPGLMSKDFASTGSAGTIIDHIPAS